MPRHGHALRATAEAEHVAVGPPGARPASRGSPGQHGAEPGQRTHVPAEAYQDIAAEFSPDEIAALVSLIVTINAWNAISVSTRAWVPGSCQP